MIAGEKLVVGIMGAMVDESHRLRDSVVESTKGIWYRDGFEDGMRVGIERARRELRNALGIDEFDKSLPYWEIRDQMLEERRLEEKQLTRG